jgi:hypothetical protein
MVHSIFSPTNIQLGYPVSASEWRQAESGHRRGPKTVPAQTAEVILFSLFSSDFKPKVMVVMIFLW